MLVEADSPKIEALVTLMCRANLDASHINAEMLALAREQGRSIDTHGATTPLLDIDAVAADLGRSSDELLDAVIVRLFKKYASPANGCSIRDKRQ